jgi:methyl-accepting chemotaxis protein
MLRTTYGNNLNKEPKMTKKNGTTGITLAKKLYSLVGILVFMIIIGTFIALATQQYLVSEYESLSQVQYAMIDHATQARYETEVSVREMKNFIIRREDKWAEAFRKAIANARIHLAKYAMASQTAEEKKMAEEAMTHLERHAAGFEDSFNALKNSPAISIQELDRLQAGINRPIAAVALKMQESALKDYDTRSKELHRLSVIVAYILVGGSLGFAAIGVFVVVMFVRRLLSSITTAVDTAVKVSEGDLTVNVSSRSGDEIGLMMEKIGEMVDHLKGDVGSLKQASTDIATGSHHLDSQSVAMTRTLTEQGSRATQIATAAEEMSQTVADVARNAADIAASSAEAASVARQGELVVQQSVTESQAIAETVTHSAEVVKTLGERSQQIGEIVSVINDIADQTNLLALNAAIEAARAGEQGRGFAVVADEVRKLAERTARATSEISGMIRGIQDEVGNAVVSMETANEKVERGLKLSADAGIQLQKIVESVSGLQSMVQQIASATEEMSSTSEGISGDIQEIAIGANSLKDGSDQIARSASELSMLSDQLKSIVEHYKA